MAKRLRKYSSAKRVRVRSKKWALLGVVVLLLTIPMTIALVAQSQDIRQNASTTYVSSVNITTMPTDILKISISQENGNAQQNNSDGNNNDSQQGNQQGNNDSNQQDGSGGGADCTTEDVTNKSVGGMMRTININCNGQDQSIDQSGSDGNNQEIKSGGKDGQSISNPKDKTKHAKDTKKAKADKKPKKSKNIIQQWIDMILGRQGSK